jgi:hypothetical protein
MEKGVVCIPREVCFPGVQAKKKSTSYVLSVMVCLHTLRKYFD